MPFGLRNGPGPVQRTMAVKIFTERWKHALVYSEDIVVFSKSPQEHIGQLQAVPSLLCKEGDTLKFKKVLVVHLISQLPGMCYPF